MSVKEIESAIEQLPTADMAELAAWLVEYHHRKWDQRIELDLESGRLDSLLEQVDREYQAGLARPL